MTPPRTGRPREFDAEIALEQAMEAFWERGYESTSIADLLEATGLQKGSLYKAFGDKRSLYLSALRRYLDLGHQKAVEALGADMTAREALSSWLECVSTGCSRDGGRGCFGVNALVELGGQDDAVADLMGAHFKRLNAALESVIARGQAQGEFRTDATPAEQADFLSVFLSGLSAKARGPLSKARAKRLIAGALSALDT